MTDVNANQRMQEFMNREFPWAFTAGECNFLIQLLAHLVQENPPLVRNPKGEMERLNYQSLRTVVLLNEKLSGQLQNRAEEASIVMGQVPASEKVQ
jgi:hypothetical protein